MDKTLSRNLRVVTGYVNAMYRSRESRNYHSVEELALTAFSYIREIQRTLYRSSHKHTLSGEGKEMLVHTFLSLPRLITTLNGLVAEAKFFKLFSSSRGVVWATPEITPGTRLVETCEFEPGLDVSDATIEEVEAEAYKRNLIVVMLRLAGELYQAAESFDDAKYSTLHKQLSRAKTEFISQRFVVTLTSMQKEMVDRVDTLRLEASGLMWAAMSARSALSNLLRVEADRFVARYVSEKPLERGAFFVAPFD